ncbi:uncharacterized protein [Antedon mediterranea]|uniref:uncharacterized protein n=1 Tax=Antedon mediterranea TaxID=105859 RepID=UPI003AF9181D
MASTTAHNMTTRQGHSAGTILTNRSKNITVINPYVTRRAETAGSTKKGTRWMHRTTIDFSLDTPDSEHFYDTSTRSAFGGSRRLPPGVRLTRCPTLHTSHFDINMDNKQYFNTFYKHSFQQKPTEHPSSIQYPMVVNRSHNVVGTDMQTVLRRHGNRLNYWSSYADTHSRLGLQRGEGVERTLKPRQKYDILSGNTLGTEPHQEWHRISGNRVMHARRQDAVERFVLG